MASAPIETKPAAGLLGGAISTLTVGLLARYTSYNPDPAEVGAIVTLTSFGVAWLVPSRVLGRVAPDESQLEGGEPADGSL
ncbi:MAG: hypothetical protein AB7O78_01625 [Thermoleophilia bacterium]